MSNPLVSIITPCYNGEAYLDRYFNSILNQTYRPLELIFVNDGSTDRTAEIAEHYAPVLKENGISFICLYQENAGQAAALNRGLKLFTGEYLTWPDADDEMTPDCIEKKVSFLQSNPELEMCICKGTQVLEEKPSESIGMLERIPPACDDNLFEDLMFLRNVFYTPGGYMVRTDAVEEAIPQRDIYPGRGGQNVQMLLPIAYRRRYGYINDVLFKYYVRANSHSHSVDTVESVIKQYAYFERLLLETLKRMPEQLYSQYSRTIQKKYARIRFGNALDSRNPCLILQSYRELQHSGSATFMDWIRLVRYVNPARIYRHTKMGD